MSHEEREIANAFDGNKIGDESKKELWKALAYVFTLIGLTTLPNDLESEVLEDFLRTEYRGLSVNEFRQAFKMAAKGSLDCDTNHYQNFSSQYVAKILNAYFVKAKEVRLLVERKEVAQISKEIPKEANWSQTWEELKESAKKSPIGKMIIPLPLYDWLVSEGILTLTVDEKIDLFDEVFLKYKSDLKSKKESGIITRQEIIDYEQIRDISADELKKGYDLHVRLAIEAKKTAIKNLLYGKDM